MGHFADTTTTHLGTDYGYQMMINSASEILLKQFKKDMSLNSIAKRLFDGDTKTLIKAGFLDVELNLTREGRDAMWAILFDANKSALVAAATEKIAEEKAEK